MPTVVRMATTEQANSTPTIHPSTRLRARIPGRIWLNTNRAPSRPAKAAPTRAPRSSI